MAIIKKKDLKDIYWSHVSLPKRCFLCGKKLSAPFVYWMGQDACLETEAQHLFLHPQCAIDISVSLICDGKTVSIEMKGYRRLPKR